jgi:hypothetical protein
MDAGRRVEFPDLRADNACFLSPETGHCLMCDITSLQTDNDIECYFKDALSPRLLLDFVDRDCPWDQCHAVMSRNSRRQHPDLVPGMAVTVDASGGMAQYCHNPSR